MSFKSCVVGVVTSFQYCSTNAGRLSVCVCVFVCPVIVIIFIDNVDNNRLPDGCTHKDRGKDLRPLFLSWI